MEDFIGFGALGEALTALARGGYRRILVVASESAWKRFNTPAEREFFAQSAGRDVRVFRAFSPNPAFAEIEAGAALAKDFQPELIFALGGGSAIDVAKGIKAFAYAAEPYDPAAPQLVKVSDATPPLVAVSTTAGSGAEATPFSIFYAGKKKLSLSAPSLRPQMAVVDPEMTYSLPPAQTASTGIDALAQGVEAFWSALGTEESRKYAAAAIKYALPNLYNAVHAPAPGNRYHMIMAAYMSGQAITTTRTTIPHGLGYHLTKEYGLPHGHAVALTLPYFFRINMDASLEANYPGGAEAQRANMNDLFKLMEVKTEDNAFIFWRNLMKACGLAPRLVDAGVDTREKMEALVASFDVTKAGGHPVKVTAEYLVDYFLANP